MNVYKLFEKRTIDFCYCNIYVPKIDDKLSGVEYQKNKLFIATPFDIIILPIGFLILYNKYKGLKRTLEV